MVSSRQSKVEVQPDTRLIESLDKKGEKIEIVEMNENHVPYKKVFVTKDDADQFNVEVYEDQANDDFTDDYDSAELSVPEEREANEYLYTEQEQEQKPKQLEESSGSFQHLDPREGSDGREVPYSDGNSSHQILQPLSIDNLENLYNEVHGDGNTIQVCSEPNPVSLIPQITSNSIFLNCYSEEIYDVLLDDLRKQYEHLIQSI